VPSPEFPVFLERSLDVLREQVPEAYRELDASLAGQRLRVAVDGAARVLRFAGGEHALAPDGAADAELRTRGETILALVDGELGLLDAITRDALFLRGPVEAVVRLDAALHAYLAGAVRAPGFPPLLHAYRSGVLAAQEPC